MRRIVRFVCLGGLLGTAVAGAQTPVPAPSPAASAASQAAPAPEPPSAPQLSAEECVVWARELGFARAVVEHDAKAFAEHVHEQAAFGAGGARPTRGRDAIVAEWAGLIEGKRLLLRWYPRRVTIGGAPDIAWSTGPALYQKLDPGAQPRYSIGTYQSVWQRGADGVWRVLFDDGIAPRPATEAEAMAFRSARSETCPQR